MGSESIREAALSQFAQHGYAGASLREIAEAAGIKKPSIYAHYDSKEDLFLQVIRYVTHQTTKEMIAYFREEKHQQWQVYLEQAFYWVEEQFHKNEYFALMMRTAFFPPAGLEERLEEIINPFYDRLARLLEKWIQKQLAASDQVFLDNKSVALTYLTLLDGTLVELLYTGKERYYKRVQAAWPVFLNGIQHHGKENENE